MNEHDQPIRDEKLEAYLDGSMSDTESRAFMESLGTDRKRRAEVELQARIDQSLERLFASAAAPESHVHDLVSRATGAVEVFGRAGSRRRIYWIAGLAIAASIAGIVLVTHLVDDRRVSPYFQTTPLAQLYQKTIDNGFEPYYECRDDSRFTAVFQRRLEIPLHLLPMPEGSRMLGLSYPGGLSRETTAMLCEIDEQPVMVFVDRLDADQAAISSRDGGLPEIHIFRNARQGLVFYEVSPFDRARATEFLVLESNSTKKSE